MPFTVFLALKYLKPTRSVASFITCVSVVGVTIGVAAVIIVRAVMTGFGDLWEQKILNFKPHVSLVPCGGEQTVPCAESFISALEQIDGVTAVTPEVDTRCLLEHKGRVSAPVLLGVDSDRFSRAYRLGAPLAGTYDLDGDSIVLGVDLARQLGAWTGDEVTVYSPKTLVDRDEIFLPVKWTVAGVFSSGHRDYDSGFAVGALHNVRDLLGLEDGVLAIHLKCRAPAVPEEFGRVCAEVRAAAGDDMRLITWREADRELFNALAVEKNMMALLLSLIAVVGLFCVMNTLLVLTVQKTPEIGLLKALRFSNVRIMGVFLVHGLIQCTMGVGLGLASAWAVLANLQTLVEQLAHFGVEVFPKSVYGLDELPYRIVSSDVWCVVVTVYAFCLVASLVPALAAALKKPVDALKG